MKIQQENLPYKPITIKLEKRHEAEAFISMMDKISVSHDDQNGVEFETEERLLAIQIYDEFTQNIIV